MAPMLSFSELDSVSGLIAGFTTRVPGLEVDVDREEAMQRLAASHESARHALVGNMPMATAEQVHGCGVAEVDTQTRFPVTGADALVTTQAGLCLGIYVADCAAVFLADRYGRGIGLVHSGRKGTELGIVPAAVRSLCHATSGSPRDVVAQISPCIRPPHYEVDIATEITRQLRSLGVVDIHDCGLCTASAPEQFYSYRREKGKTGRMLALIAIR